MNNKLFFYLFDLGNSSGVARDVVIFFADTFPYIVVFLAFVFLVLYKNSISNVFSRKKEVVLVFASGVVAWLSALVLKSLFYAQRPFDIFSAVDPLLAETGYSFPSNHATFFMALAVALYFFNKKAGFVFSFFALLIGLSRIMSGVHFPLDILGGFVLGFAISYAIAYFVKKI